MPTVWPTKKNSFHTQHLHVSDELGMASYFFTRLKAAKGLLTEAVISVLLVAGFFLIISHVSTRYIDSILPRSLVTPYNKWSPALIAVVVIIIIVRIAINLKGEWVKWRGPAPCDVSCPVDFTPVAVGQFAGRSLFEIAGDYGLAPLVIAQLETANVGRRQHRGHRILSMSDPLREGQTVAWPIGVGIPGYGRLAGFIPLSSSAVAGAEELEAAIYEHGHSDDPAALLDAVVKIQQKTDDHVLTSLEDMKDVAAYLAQRGERDGIFMFTDPSELKCPWLVAELAWRVPSEFLSPAWMSVHQPRWSPSTDDFLDLVACVSTHKKFSDVRVTSPDVQSVKAR